MKIDFYTKAVLTIIAASLSVIAVRGFVPLAKAQNDGPVHVIVDQIGLYSASLPLPVRTQ